MEDKLNSHVDDDEWEDMAEEVVKIGDPEMNTLFPNTSTPQKTSSQNLFGDISGIELEQAEPLEVPCRKFLTIFLWGVVLGLMSLLHKLNMTFIVCMANISSSFSLLSLIYVLIIFLFAFI